MAKYAKWIGGALGFTLGGPIGAIIGFAVGSMIDNSTDLVKSEPGRNYGSYGYTTAGDFTMSLLVLSAAIMKTDGKVMRSELDYVKRFFVRQFGERRAQEYILLLRDIMKQPMDIRAVSYQIRQNMEHPLRLQLLHYLFGLAMADGSLSPAELRTIEEIARYLNINPKDFESLKAMVGPDVDSAYKILEIEKTATESEIKSAYRRMAIKYHPDKVIHLGEEFQKAAREKFQKVQEAYESIKKERGFV